MATVSYIIQLTLGHCTYESPSGPFKVNKKLGPATDGLVYRSLDEALDCAVSETYRLFHSFWHSHTSSATPAKLLNNNHSNPSSPENMANYGQKHENPAVRHAETRLLRSSFFPFGSNMGLKVRSFSLYIYTHELAIISICKTHDKPMGFR